MSYLIQSPLEKPNPKSPSNLSSYINTYISSYIDNYLKNDDSEEERNSHEKSRFNYFDTVDDRYPPTSPQNTEIKDISNDTVKNNKPYSPVEKEEKYHYKNSYTKNNNYNTRKLSDESRTSTPTLAEEDNYSVENTYKTEEKTLYSTPRLPESERDSISFEDNVNEEYYMDPHHEKIKYNDNNDNDPRYQNQQHEYNYRKKYSDLYSNSSNIDDEEDEEDEDYEYTKEYNDNYYYYSSHDPHKTEDYKKDNNKSNYKNEYHEDCKEEFRGRKPYRDSYNENGKESFSITESINNLDQLSSRRENYNRNSQQSFDSVSTITRTPRTASLNNRLRTNSPAGSMISGKSNSNLSSSLPRTNSVRSKPLIISNENSEVQKVSKKKSFFKFLKKLTGTSDKNTKSTEINNNKAYATHSNQSSSSNVLTSPTLSHTSSIHSSTIRPQLSSFSSSSHQSPIHTQNNFNSTQSIQPSQSSIRISQEPTISTPITSPKSSPVQSPIQISPQLGGNSIGITKGTNPVSEPFEKINNHVRNNDTSDNKLLGTITNTDKLITTTTTATTKNNNNNNNNNSSIVKASPILISNDPNNVTNVSTSQTIKNVNSPIISSTPVIATTTTPNISASSTIDSTNEKVTPHHYSSISEVIPKQTTTTIPTITAITPIIEETSSTPTNTKTSNLVSFDNVNNTSHKQNHRQSQSQNQNQQPKLNFDSSSLRHKCLNFSIHRCTYNKKKYNNKSHSIIGKRSNMNPNISLASANLNPSISYLRSARRKSHRMDNNNILPRTPSIILDQFSEYSDSTIMSEDHTDYKIFNWNYDDYDDEKAIISSDESSSLNINLIDHKLRDLSASFSDHSKSRSFRGHSHDHNRDYDYDHEYEDEYEYEYDPNYRNKSNSSIIHDKSRSSCYSNNSDSRTSSPNRQNQRNQRDRDSENISDNHNHNRSSKSYSRGQSNNKDYHQYNDSSYRQQQAESAYIEEATPSKFYDATTITTSFTNPYSNCKSLYSDLNENSSEYYDSRMNTTTIESSKKYQSYIATDSSDSSDSSEEEKENYSHESMDPLFNHSASKENYSSSHYEDINSVIDNYNK